MGFEDRVRERWRRVRLGRASARESPDGADAVAPPDPEPLPTRTFIGSGAELRGTLQLTGDFCIDSDFDGSLATDGCVRIGAGGSVQGEISAREVVIEGAVVGNVSARRRLILRSTARLHGDVETACLEVERHAFFQGRTTMTRPQAELRPTPPAAAHPAGSPGSD